MVVNPHAELKPVTNGDVVNAITVRAPLLGESLRVTTIERSVEPEVFGALLVHMITGDVVGAGENLSAAERTRLSEVGFLVPSERVSRPVWYSCDVLDPPVSLIPERARRPTERADVRDDLVVNPGLRHLGRAGPPASMRGRVKLGNRFRTDRSWLWVQEPDVCAPSVYSYSDADKGLDALIPGEEPPNSLTHDARQRLLDAGVIGSAARLHRQSEMQARRIDAANRELRRARYTVLPHVIAPAQIAAVRQYYRDLIDGGFLVFGDAEWPNRYFSSRDPMAHFFHAQLTDLVSAIAGERLKPSFPFFASYHAGSTLPIHRDREQCEYSMSILVDYSPEPADLSPWPLFVQPPGATSATPVNMGIGDGVFYYGREVLHYRETLTRPESCSCWFFFYVPEGFEGPLD